MITILTATYNVKHHLPQLIESLRAQADTNFHWIVVDGNSSDGTVALLHSIQDLNITVISEPDFSIYDALNKGLALIKTEYYLVVGADDILYPEAVAQYNAQADLHQADIITAPIHLGEKQGLTRTPSSQWSWTGGIHSVISNHSVGTLIRKDLHHTYGNYSNRFSIAADMLFLLRAYRGGAQIARIDTIVGKFQYGGISSRYTLQSIFESTVIRLENGGRLELEIPYMCLRIARHYTMISRNLRQLKQSDKTC
jgi:glycosyltransferase involved in cell wall biosynthesis